MSPVETSAPKHDLNKTVEFLHKIYILFFRRSFARVVAITLISGGIAWLSPTPIIYLLNLLAAGVTGTDLEWAKFINDTSESQIGGFTLIALGIGVFIYDQYMVWVNLENAKSTRRAWLIGLMGVMSLYGLLAAAFIVVSDRIQYQAERELALQAQLKRIAKIEPFLEEASVAVDLASAGVLSGYSRDQWALMLSPSRIESFLQSSSPYFSTEDIQLMMTALGNINFALEQASYCQTLDDSTKEETLIYANYKIVWQLLSSAIDRIKGVDTSSETSELVSALSEQYSFDYTKLYGTIYSGCKDARFTPLETKVILSTRYQEGYVHLDFLTPDILDSRDLKLTVYPFTYVTQWDLVSGHAFSQAYKQQCVPQTPFPEYFLSLRCNDTYKLEGMDQANPNWPHVMRTMIVAQYAKEERIADEIVETVLDCTVYVVDMKTRMVEDTPTIYRINENMNSTLTKSVYDTTGYAGMGVEPADDPRFSGLRTRQPVPRYSPQKDLTLDEFKEQVGDFCLWRFGGYVYPIKPYEYRLIGY
ncbi:hypothetical protein HBA55_30870 [Pseudomaricurvus alkylphenolicus]|uniref:hypothetical protein n=1 Tax=Pseudomaricurvus alkylphenolicus TaxID=1306991 RepID=UPI00141FC0CE|nr:hypothetical protein [Pseudomaricurvus alkylphenolicus]NIB44044.1 hypothetical protein [Pseudomaricurvus alkylphenolicus]